MKLNEESISMKGILSQFPDIDLNQEDNFGLVEENSLKKDIELAENSPVEENQNASTYKNLLDNQWQEKNINYHESDIIKSQFDNSDLCVNLKDLQNQEVSYQIFNDDFLKLAEIEFTNSAASNFDYLVKKMEGEQNLQALYQILKYYEQSTMGEAKDDVIVQNFLKRITTIQTQEYFIHLLKQSLDVYQNISVENLIYIISQTKNIEAKFSIECLKQLLTLKGDVLLIDQIVGVVKILSEIMFSKFYSEDPVLENQIENFLQNRIFSNLKLDVLSLKPCFFDLLKICMTIKSVKSNHKIQEYLVEASLHLYGGCFHIPEAEDENNNDHFQVQAFKDIQSTEKFTRCVHILSKNQQSEINPETKVLFMTFVENILVHQVYTQSQIILYQIMDILVNTSVLYDMQKFTEINNYVKQNLKLLFSDQQEQLDYNHYQMQQISQLESNSKGINKQSDFEIEDIDQNSIKIPIHYRICSYIRFATKFKFIKDLELDFIDKLVQFIPKNDQRPFAYMYESILSNHSHWMLEDRNKTQTFLHLQDICYVILKQTPYQLNFPISFCVTLRNYISFNSLFLKKYHIKIVDISQYTPSNVLKQGKLKNQSNSSESDDEQSIDTKQICFPFNTELIKKISSQNKNLKLFLEQYMYEESSEMTIQKKKKYIFDQIEYQIANNFPKPNDIFEIIRTQNQIRKELQQNPTYFELIKKYSIFLLKADYSHIIQTSNPQLSKSTQEIQDNQSNMSNQTVEKSIEAKGNYQLSQKTQNEGEKIFGEVLFFTRLCLENQSRSIDFQIIVNFIINNVNYMDFIGLMFSKQFMNTTNMRDPRVHSAIQKRIMVIIKQEHLNLKNSLNLLKAFSLDDFDNKTLFLLENEIISKLNLINHTNIAVLLKKYYYKAKYNPLRFASGISQNAYKYLPQINDQTYWIYLFLSKFKPQALQSLNLQQIQFEKDALQNEYLLKFIQLFANYDLEKLNLKKLEFPQVMQSFNKEYCNDTNEEIQDMTKEIYNRSQILLEKLQFYLIKAPQQNPQDVEILNYLKNKFMNSDTFIPPQKSTHLLLYLQLFYYFRALQKDKTKILITPQNANLTVNALFAQYQKKINLNLKELVQGCFYVNEMCKRNDKHIHLTPQHFQKLLEYIQEQNREQILAQTPCLTTLMKMYQMIEFYLQSNPNNLMDQEIQKLIQQLKSQFMYYKIKRNESKDILIQWVYLLARNSNLEKQANSVSILTNLFSKQDQQILDKLEHIFLKNIDNLNNDNVLEIFNAYLVTELCSFQILEQLEIYLKNMENEQKTLGERVERNQELKNNQQKISLPFQHKTKNKYQN
ncbi:hypothetical protein ABPG74_011408 [Tetrahymena malaccensis]